MIRYFDENGKAHYLLADYLGNVTMQLLKFS